MGAPLSLLGSVVFGSKRRPPAPLLPWAAACYEFTACDRDADCADTLEGGPHPPPPEFRPNHSPQDQNRSSSLGQRDKEIATALRASR